MKKYMGNKSRILPKILEAAEFAPKKCTIFDAFAGTTNVGQYFKKNGYRVVSNDVNAVSKLLGEVYLCQNEIPSFNALFSSNCYSIKKIKELLKSEVFENKKNTFLVLNRNTNNENFLKDNINSNAYNLLVYLSFFASQVDYSSGEYFYKPLAPDFFWRNFCAKGTKSTYFNLVSQKSIQSQIELLKKYEKLYGNTDIITRAVELLQNIYTPPFNVTNLIEVISLLETNINLFDNQKFIIEIIIKLRKLSQRSNNTGNRMFFSEIHGHKIDIVNNLALIWRKEGLINVDEYNFILCSLVEAVTLFSNTSATYQAFYKTYRANTLQEFRLIFPEIIHSDFKHKVYCDDTFELIKNMNDSYDIMYLDPPYNWRIYDSNYHLLNLLSDFYNISDNVLEYESGIAGAAGENRKLIRNYTNYNRRVTFEDLLFKLILAASCKYFILSYSDSLSNHNKNSLSSVQKIENFFKNSDVFIPSSFRKIEIASVNFESRRSKTKECIHELIFIAQKKG